MSEEVNYVYRTRDPNTGGEKGTKLPQLAWAPAYALLKLAEVYGYGAAKYAPNNFRQGYKLSLSLNALWRHVLAFQGGEDNDPESGFPHMAHAAWHCLNLIQQIKDHPQLDDRWDANVKTQTWSIPHASKGVFSITVPDLEGRDV